MQHMQDEWLTSKILIYLIYFQIFKIIILLTHSDNLLCVLQSNIIFLILTQY